MPSSLESARARSTAAFAIGVSLWLLASPLRAQREEPAPEFDEGDAAPTLAELLGDEEVGPVVVTGTRSERLLSESPVATEVIERDEIERSGARDVAEMLEEREGLHIQRTFRGAEIWLRGLDPDYSLILVDGERVPGRLGGAIDLSRFGVENIERIEIVRGPASALYGSEAIGGVVNILTRDSEEEFEANGMAAYGMGNVFDATAMVGGRLHPRLSMRATGGFHYADPFQRDFTGDGTSAESPVTAGSSRMQWSGGGRITYRPTDALILRAQADYLQQELRGVDGGAGGAIFDRTQLQEQLQTSFMAEVRGADGLHARNRFTYSLFRDQFLLDQRGASQLDSYQENIEQSGQATSTLHFRAPGNQGITVGAEGFFQELDSQRLDDLGRRFRFAAFIQDEWTIIDEPGTSLTVVPGLRYDVDSQFGDQLAPKLTVRYDPVEQLVLRASYGRGFRAPTFQELLLRFENPSVGYLVTGNPELGAETSHSVDAGFEWTPFRELSFHASFFRNDLENMIAVVTAEDPGTIGTLLTYENLDNAWTMGLESRARVKIEDFLVITGGYTLTETWDGQNERRLQGRPLHRFTLSATATYRPWEVDFTARGALMLDRVYFTGDPDGIYPDPVAQVDLRMSKSFDRHLELFVGIDNLLDAGDAFYLIRPFTLYGGARGRY